MADKLRELLGETPSRALFCYPQLASPYLLSDGRNPTPYQFLFYGVSPDDQIRDALRILEQERVPYVVGSPLFFRPKDPLVRYITQHYEFVPLPEIEEIGELPGYWLYRRKREGAPAGAPG